MQKDLFCGYQRRNTVSHWLNLRKITDISPDQLRRMMFNRAEWISLRYKHREGQIWKTQIRTKTRWWWPPEQWIVSVHVQPIIHLSKWSLHCRLLLSPTMSFIILCGRVLGVPSIWWGGCVLFPRGTPSTRPQRRFWEVCHRQALAHQGPPNRLAGSPTHHTHRRMVPHTHQRGHRDRQTRHCATGHRLFHQRHLATNTTDWRIFYIQSP